MNYYVTENRRLYKNFINSSTIFSAWNFSFMELSISLSISLWSSLSISHLFHICFGRGVYQKHKIVRRMRWSIVISTRINKFRQIFNLFLYSLNRFRKNSIFRIHSNHIKKFFRNFLWLKLKIALQDRQYFRSK